MGIEEVVVGCIHRLALPIGERTGRPCAICEGLTPPFLALAYTIKHPRLAAVATRGAARTDWARQPEVKFPAVERLPAEVHPASSIAGPAIVSAVETIARRVMPGPMVVNVERQTPEDFAANVVRMSVHQEMRVRREH